MPLQNIRIPFEIFREGEKFIAFCPLLDLATAGDTFEQGNHRFSEVVEIFIEELERKGTLDKVLTDLGWQKVSYPKRHWVPPVPIAKMESEIKIPCPA